MKPQDGTYKLEKKELGDVYANAPAYLSKLSPVAKGVPYIDENTRPFEKLIRKAIEIVRRKPYCEKITDAYLSKYKGSKSDPVFYVTYDRSDGLPRNFFLSKSEIEASK
ncbi:hypothetical protein [uncultured Microbulbifer sp.]|uniref:hypothetical protein n=1 Tax=uncultured Microbulbifer sp. TaxID=348147 RepID=UPI0026019C12|nr:hypothetical protein [uncultured Microbulbifer sp.]